MDQLSQCVGDLEAFPTGGTTADQVQYVQDHGQEVRPEVLVCIYRSALAGGQDALRECVAGFLFGRPDGDGGWIGGHCEHIIRKRAGFLGITANDAALSDFRQRCYVRIIKGVSAAREEKPFWEERFYVAVVGAVMDTVRAYGRERDKRDELQEAVNVSGRAPSGRNVSPVEDLGHAELLRAIDGLRDPVRRAAQLVWIYGYPVESQDPEVVTAATVLQRTGRTVRNYLQEARSELGAFRT